MNKINEQHMNKSEYLN